MNLVIDIGNSAAKVSVIGPLGEVLHTLTVAELTSEILDELFTQFSAIDLAILSTTRHPEPELETHIAHKVRRFVSFDPTTPTPLKNRYASPKTLGADRLAAAVGAWNTAPGQELLVVDFGSAITIDRVSAAGEYLGGNISPGMQMRFDALHALTDRLPLCSANGPEPLTPTGTSTVQAIRSGVILGIIHEIEGYIAHHPSKSPLILFFTGRDGKFFADNIKKPIFVIADLVTAGLNQILEHNIQHEDTK